MQGLASGSELAHESGAVLHERLGFDIEEALLSSNE